uniref:ATPase domain-containing protein n=1 Tax=Panagrellus redivivus TaxID=6233 RepID=A0A7E4VVL9_PANRE
MLNELTKALGDVSGLAFVEHEADSEPSLIVLHFLSEFVKAKGRVVYVSLFQSEEMVRTACGKLAIRLDANNFRYVQIRDFLTRPDGLKALEDTVLSLATPDTRTLVIIDSALIFAPLTSNPVAPVQFCQRLRRSLIPSSLILLASADASTFIGFEDIATATFRPKLVNRGAGKNVTGVLEVSHHTTPFDATPQTHTYHYLLGERSLKLFLPGVSQFLI